MFSGVIKRYGVFVLLAFVFSGCTVRWMGSPDTSKERATLTVVSSGGGAYQQSHRKSFIQPFSEITGIKVNSLLWDMDYGKLKTMVKSGHVPWDVVDVTASEFSLGRRDGLYQNLTIKPHDGQFFPNSVTDQGVANVYWGIVLAYGRGAFGSAGPKSWRDFWDVHRFPGPRALYDGPKGNLEFALLADGVPLDKLYPLDVDRAFKKLNEIKPYVKSWYTDGAQPVQWILSKSVVMSSAWNGRIFASPEAKAAIDYTWRGAALELDYWVIPKGSAHVDTASRFIFFASLPWTMAQQVEAVGYGPANIAALDLVPPDIRSQLPTYPANRRLAFVLNADWWAAHEESVDARWKAWKSH